MALRPATPVEPYPELLDDLDMLQLMTVEPGFGGQKLLVLPMVRAARELVKGGDLDLWLQVDGGLSADTIGASVEAGADVFVAGSAVYGAEDAAAAVAGLRETATRATDAAYHGS